MDMSLLHGHQWLGYGVITLLSYIIGQKKYPVSYPLKDMAIYLILAAVLFVLSAGGYNI